jgi:hypothetical protein
MRMTAAIPVACLMAVLSAAWADQSGILSTEIKDKDWEISNWADVRRGQAAIQQFSSGNKLRIYYLAKSFNTTGDARIQMYKPAVSGNHYLLSSFDNGRQNGLGGFFNPFFSIPSSAGAAVETWEDGRRALTFEYLKAATGFCGLWVHLFDDKKPRDERAYLDASSFDSLAFWVRGSEGNEQVLLKAADAVWERKEDALPIGKIADFLPEHRVEKYWQPAIVPLKKFPLTLNLRALASLSLESVHPGSGRIAIKDLAFCRGFQPPPLSLPLIGPAGRKPSERAMWVWNTRDILARPEQQAELIAFAHKMGISHLFLQLPNEPSDIGSRRDIQIQEKLWKPFLESLNSAGIHAYALDGAKNYALTGWHERVLSTVDNIIRYNASAEPRQKFWGIHYDIEPYLLDGYHGPRRKEILQDYLHLIERITAKTRASNLVCGIDIPFWYDAPDQFSAKTYLVEFGGQLKTVSQHVIDLADQIGIMDYRTTSYGADGIIAHARDELAYAQEKGKSIFVGVETIELPNEILLDFEGEPAHGLPEIRPSGYGVILIPGSGKGTVLAISGDQLDIERRRLSAEKLNLRSVLWWQAKATLIPSTKLTFAKLGIGRLNRAIAQAEEEFREYASFAGFAIHDYLGYRRLALQTED